MELSRKAIVGFTLVITAIFASALLIRFTDKTELYWVTTKKISAGDRVGSDDVALARLYLPGRESIYVSSSEEIMGLMVTGSLSAGEAIARSDLTDRSDNILWRLVSLDIGRSDIPISVSAGSVIDIYRLADPTGALARADREDVTELVLTSLVVDQVIPGGTLSERTQLILRVRLPEVRLLLEAYAKGPLLVVDHMV